MLRSRVSGRVPSLVAVLALFFAAPAQSDDAPPPESGSQSPRETGSEARMPEKSLMPKAEDPVPDLDGPFALDYLKKMSGDWESEAGTVVASYRITAGGSAVVETLFPGSDREMTSVYHMDGNDLIATVYAPEGSQPRLKFDLKRSFAGKYFFMLAGGAGFDRTKDLHIHERSLQFTGLDRIDAELIVYEGRSRRENETVRLIRKKLP